MAERAADDAARERAEGWLAALEGADDEVSRRFRYLAALAAARAGLLREVGASERGGRRLARFACPRDWTTYEVEDPRLGAAEARLVEATAWALLGDAPPE